VDSGPAESFAKALFADGLEQIIESVNPEGAKRKPIVCRDEDDLRKESWRR